jgi:hypothetical protein
MGPKMSIVVSTNYVIFVYLHVSQLKFCLYLNITCVMLNMWFWHNANAGIAF